MQARLRARMSWAYSDVFSATSEAQESADWTEFLALRADLGGPSRMSVGGRPVRWGAFAGYAGFHDIEADALGFSSLYDAGLSLAVPTRGSLPDVQLSGAVIFGPEVSGWSLGLGLSL